MSFQSREKKRRYKAAVKRSKRANTAKTEQRWFLTLATRKASVCAVCDAKLVKGDELVYRHKPVEIRCVDCGRRKPDSKGFRPSLRWERARLANRRA